MGEGEVADGTVALDGDFERRGKVMLMLGRYGGWLFPLTEEAIMNEGLIGIYSARVGTASARAT